LLVESRVDGPRTEPTGSRRGLLRGGNRQIHAGSKYDGSVEKLYLNGVLDSSNAASAGSLCQAAVPVKLGMETSAFLPFTGVLDEVEIYNQALTAEVVSIL